MSLGICLLLSVSRLYIFSDGSIPKLSEAIWRTPDGHDAGLGRLPLHRYFQEEKADSNIVAIDWIFPEAYAQTQSGF